MDLHRKGQVLGLDPRFNLLRRVGRAVVHDQMQHRDLLAPQTAKEHRPKARKVHKAFPLAAACDRLPAVNKQGKEQVQDALTTIAAADAQRTVRLRRHHAAGHGERLHTSLLIGTDDDLSARSQAGGLFVQLQHDGRFLQKAWIGRFLPGANLPGFDAHLLPPAAASAPESRTPSA